MDNRGCLSAIAYTIWILALLIGFALAEPSVVVALMFAAFCLMGGFLTSEIIYRIDGS